MKQLTFDDIVKNIIDGNEVYINDSLAELAISYTDIETGESVYITKDDPITQDCYVIDPNIKYELSIVDYLGRMPIGSDGKAHKTFIHEHDTIAGAIKWANDIILAELGCEALFQYSDSTTIKDKRYKIYSIHSCVYIDGEAKMIGQPIGALRELPANEIVGN